MKTIKQELKNLSAQELAAKVEVLRRELFSARLHKATKPLQDTAQTKRMRRDIARALTYLRQKQAEV